MPQITELKYLMDVYGTWAKAEGVPIHVGLSVDLNAAEVAPWPRFGVDGALVHMNGRGDFASLFLLEIRGGSATTAQKHLFEEIVYVVDGDGSTEIETSDGRSVVYRWGPRSLFAIPLNACYRHRNGSRTSPARLASIATLQVMLNLYHNEDFVFSNDGKFPARERQANATDLFGTTTISPGRTLGEASFLADATKTPLTPWPARGDGLSTVNLILADGTMHAQISEIAPGIYEKGSRFGTEFHFLPICGTGYSLMWKAGDRDATRIDWKPGVVFAPTRGMHYQHFNTGAGPARYLAVTVGSMRYPFVDENFRMFAGGADTKVAEGGNQVEYEDQDARIHLQYLQELEKNKVAPRRP